MKKASTLYLLALLVSISLPVTSPAQEDLDAEFSRLPEKVKRELLMLSHFEEFRTPEGMEKVLEDIRICAKNSSREADLLTFWKAAHAFRYKRKLENQQIDEAIELTDRYIQEFVTRFEEGMDLGSDQDGAAMIYQTIKDYENQSVDTTAVSATR